MQNDRVDKPAKKLGLRECKLKMLQLLNTRDFSEFSMRQRLAKAGFPQDVIDQAVAYALKSRLIDDKRFADLFISSRVQAGYGRQRIERELQERGIDCFEVPGYPDAYFDDEDELSRALSCLDSHHTSAKNARDSHFRYLLNKGFSSSIASRALRQRGM